MKVTIESDGYIHIRAECVVESIALYHVADGMFSCTSCCQPVSLPILIHEHQEEDTE